MSANKHKEIEHRYLLANDDWRKNAMFFAKITQGYLNDDPQRTVRVRLQNQDGFFTVKGPINEWAEGDEVEESISKEGVEKIFNLCIGSLIIKDRYHVLHEGWIWEVDVFKGENEGLIIAELELDYTTDEYPKPSWLGRNVTKVIPLKNSRLSKKPYSQLTEEDLK
jgi:adenylate cyclase